MRHEIYANNELIAVEELPDPEPAPPTPEERLAALEDANASLIDALDTLIIDALGTP